jgi:hypothetical protein
MDCCLTDCPSTDRRSTDCHDTFHNIGPRLGTLTWPPSWRGRRSPDDFWGRPVGPHPPWPGTGSIQVLKPILPLHYFVILLYKISNLDTKVHTFVQNFIPMYKISYLCTKFHTFVQNFIPGCKTLNAFNPWKQQPPDRSETVFERIIFQLLLVSAPRH